MSLVTVVISAKWADLCINRSTLLKIIDSFVANSIFILRCTTVFVAILIIHRAHFRCDDRSNWLRQYLSIVINPFESRKNTNGYQILGFLSIFNRAILVQISTHVLSSFADVEGNAKSKEKTNIKPFQLQIGWMLSYNSIPNLY